MLGKVNGPPTAAKKIKGDGNFLFHALCYRTIGWETALLKVRQAICSHVAAANTYTEIVMIVSLYGFGTSQIVNIKQVHSYSLSDQSFQSMQHVYTMPQSFLWCIYVNVIEHTVDIHT